MPIVTGYCTLDLMKLPAKSDELRVRFVPQHVDRKSTLLVLYPNSEPGFEPSYVRYTVMMEFRQILLSDRIPTGAHGLGQIVVTGQRLIGMITDGSTDKTILSESDGSVYAFAFDLDDIRPIKINKRNWLGKPVEAVIQSKVGQAPIFGLIIFSTDPGLFLLKDDGQVTRTSLSAFLEQLTPEGRRNLQVVQKNSKGEQISVVVFPSGDQKVEPHQTFHGSYDLNDTAAAAFQRYLVNGQVADLNLAVQGWLEALRLTPYDSPFRLALLSNLAVGLSDRYTRTGNLADLEAAIANYQQAALTAPADSPEKPTYLSNLGNGLLDRYTCTGNLADLEAAIANYQQAALTASTDSPEKPTYLSNLGIGLSYRYTRTGNLADLDAAIANFQQAVEATPPNSLSWTMYLNNLAVGLSDRYARIGNLADLETAISSSQQVVQATPSGSPNRPMYLKNLGNGLRARYTRTGNLADLEAAITAWEKSWSISHAGFTALPVAYQLGQQRQGAVVAADLITAYLEQAEQRPPRTPSAYHRALEVVEGSKSRLLTQLVGRGPLSLPPGLLPEVAVREQQLLAKLTTLDAQELTIDDHLVPIPGEASHLQRLQQRQATLHELEDLWTRVVHIGPEGTEYVALRRGAAPTWQEFTHITETLGPATALLSFFTTADQALLFLLRAGWPTPCVVEVPLNQTDWSDLLERFFREVHYYDSDLFLNETWSQPLLSLLTKAQHPLNGVERLILAPEGIGHLLPWGVLIERAGWRTPAGLLLPLVTLPALGILPRLMRRARRSSGPALVVGNPRGDLRYAGVEAKEVAERFRTKPLLGAAATKSAVLARFPDATLIHLATHAFFDADNPLESGIVLADGVLTAREVLQHRLQADLLILSACESGRVGSLGGEELAGLSQAFLQAGVRSLLVSLWQVDDQATGELIKAFYGARQDGADKALALRQAMTQIQQNPRWSDTYYWGAFVLVGDWD
jgi:CHAT domain/Tetratricopeptide repeat